MPERYAKIVSWFLLAVVMLALTPNLTAAEVDIAEENRVEDPAGSPFDTEDENSDINLKFLPHEFALGRKAIRNFLTAGNDTFPSEHIEEIITPPPLTN